MKFCTRCGKRCSDSDMICPVCGQMLSSTGIKEEQKRTSKNSTKIILVILAIIITGITVCGIMTVMLLSSRSGVSREQSDADAAMLEGDHTYSRTEKVNDDIVDIFYEIDTKNDLADYTYECQMRYAKNGSTWNLVEKQMKLLDYEWTIAESNWEREEKGINISRNYAVYIEKISQDSITIQYIIQDSTGEVKQGEETAHLDKMTDENSNIYIDEDGTLNGTVWLESETIPLELGLYFYEMAICYRDSMMTTMNPFTRIGQTGPLIDKTNNTEENINEERQEENVFINTQKKDDSLYIKYNEKKLSLPCTNAKVKEVLGVGIEEYVEDEDRQYYGLSYNQHLFFFSEAKNGENADEAKIHSIQVDSAEGLSKFKTSCGVNGNMTIEETMEVLEEKAIIYQIETYKELENQTDIVIYQGDFELRFTFEGSDMTFIVISDTTYS